MAAVKAKARRARGARRDLAEIVGRELDGDATVAGAVLVAALVAGAVVAQEQRAGVEQRAAGVRPVGEGAGDDRRRWARRRRDAPRRAVAGAGMADEFVKRPAGAARQAARRRAQVFRRGRQCCSCGWKIAIFPKRRQRRACRLLTSRRQLRPAGSSWRKR